MSFKVMDLPNQRIGNFEIIEFEVEKNNLVAMIQASKGRPIGYGKFKALRRHDEYNGINSIVTVMSNTESEIRDHRRFVNQAHGDILINGLGLGCVIEDLLKKEYIKSITVIEKFKEVIDMVSPYIKDERVKIINADAFEYKPEKGKRFDFVWHDIWDTICGSNLMEMEKLHRKYGKKTGYQESWARHLCLKQIMKDKRIKKDIKDKLKIHYCYSDEMEEF
jgi:hypothetical protein